MRELSLRKRRTNLLCSRFPLRALASVCSRLLPLASASVRSRASQAGLRPPGGGLGSGFVAAPGLGSGLLTPHGRDSAFLAPHGVSWVVLWPLVIPWAFDFKALALMRWTLASGAFNLMLASPHGGLLAPCSVLPLPPLPPPACGAQAYDHKVV